MLGGDGSRWIQSLPELIQGCARSWGLRLGPPFPGLTYNWTGAAQKLDGTAVVLKVCFPGREYQTEVAALHAFGGRGAARLLDADETRSAMLLERCVPGLPAASVSEDDATAALIATMTRLRSPPPARHPFPTIGDWIAEMAARSAIVCPPTGPFPTYWIDRAIALAGQLAVRAGVLLVLHGDLHHGNLLQAEREPWLAIDPKGVIGPAEAEIGPYLLNRLPTPWNADQARKVLSRRVERVGEGCGLEVDRVRAWGVVRAVLSAFWSLEDHGEGWERGLAIARILDSLQLA